MPSAAQVLYLLTHPNQLRAIAQYKLWHTPVHERDVSTESPELKRCFFFLDLTSRSFAAVIQELHPELLVAVSLFYLALRGLDTIEDDMTIDLKKKEPLLRNFKDVFSKPGWTFNDNGPNEKDRLLLVEFDVVISEFAKIKPAYQKIILDITDKMGNGMADYANNAEHNKNGVNTIADYDLYCHYVAGLVGEGLTRLFVEGNLANPALLERTHLHESMGLFLQKTNIIRDVREDFDDHRRFYPKEIWSKHVKNFDDVFKPEFEPAGLNLLADMTLDALRHVEDCIFYMAGLKEQSVFNFCAIPQVMAIATLELVFRNPNALKGNVKITKGDACRLILDSTNLQSVCEIFKHYIRKIHRRNTPDDPNFFNISIACGRIEKFIENIFPTQKAESQLATKEKSENEEAGTYVLIFTAATFLVLSVVMVGAAYLAMYIMNNFELFQAKLPSFTGIKHSEL